MTKIQNSKPDELVKSRKFLLNVIPAKAGHVVKHQRSSSNFGTFWMPDQVRHDELGTFYEIIKPVLVIGYWNLRFIWNLVLVI